MGSIGDQGLRLAFRCSIIKAERTIMVLFEEGKAIVEPCCKDNMVDAVDRLLGGLGEAFLLDKNSRFRFSTVIHQD